MAAGAALAMQAWPRTRSDAPVEDAPALRDVLKMSEVPVTVEPSRCKLTGAVRNDRGGAVDNARVCAVCATCDVSTTPATVCTGSDLSGAYELTLEDERAVTVTASAPGLALGQANGGRPIAVCERPMRPVDLVLHAGGARVAGMITDALGGPIADAKVQLRRSEGALQSALEARSDGDGRFELWTAPGSASIRAEAAGYAPATGHVVAPTSSLDLQLTPASTIRGTVLAVTTGKAVAGVEVRALLDGRRTRGTAAVSGDDGAFTLTGLAPGRYVLVAEHERWRSYGPLPVQVGLTDVMDHVQLPVVAAVAVLGHVVSAEPEPCLGGRVTLDAAGLPQPTAAGMQMAPSVTMANVAPDGSVVLRGITPGRYRVNVRCPEEVWTGDAEQLDVADTDVTANWRVGPGIGLEVRVLDDAGNPVPHAPLILHDAQRDHPERSTASPLVADASGVARTGTRLRPGVYSVLPGAGLHAEPVALELHDGAGRVPLTMHVHGNAFIDVSVSDVQGQPVDALHVSALPEGHQPGPRSGIALAQPQGGGGYRIGPLTAGRYEVTAADGVNHSWGDGARSLLVHVAEGTSARVRLSIERGASVRGHVFDTRGQPVANAWVSVRDEAAKLDPLQPAASADTAHRRLTDAEGAFELDGLARDGRFVVEASDAQAGEGSVRDVQSGASVRVVLAGTTTVAAAAGDRRE